MDERFVKGGPLPASLGARADLYALVRETRLGGQRAVDDMKARESEIYNSMLSELMETSGDTGASGQSYRVQLVEKPSLTVKDWPALHDWIAQHRAFELLQKRLAEPAARELLDSGTALPGVEPGSYFALSITKR